MPDPVTYLLMIWITVGTPPRIEGLSLGSYDTHGACLNARTVIQTEGKHSGFTICVERSGSVPSEITLVCGKDDIPWEDVTNPTEREKHERQ